jgi:amino acid adenylation domain-containing protein
MFFMPYPQCQLIHELFESQVEQCPDATAVVCEHRALTYAELNASANRLAHYLIQLGVQPDDRVAICAERGADMVVAIFAVLKSGGCYVPLDPDYPRDRLDYLLRDSAAKVLLSQASVQSRCSAPPNVPTVVMDNESVVSQLRQRSAANPVSGVCSQHLAYVLYTSGSAGTPKGVMVEHRNVVNFIRNQIAACELAPADRVLQFASFGFDSSVAEIFPALSAGAAIVLRPQDLMAPDASFEAFLRAHEVTVVDLPTAFWHLWTRQAVTYCPRLVIVSGEKADKRRLLTWLAMPATRHSRWLNNYGPTETTVNASSAQFDYQSSVTSSEVPIGKPTGNTNIYILDTQQQPVPIGVAGEIYIGGAGVARGYLNRPELTSECFIKDPFSGAPDSRMYKTGDAGRYLPDGNIEFLGRNDFQVKIRGFRIEPGEIEAHLTSRENIREAVVIAREDTSGDKRLVAYIVAAGSPLDVEALRAHQSSVLPEYMVPAAYVQLPFLPLTLNGKIDKKKLPKPDDTSYAKPPYEAPIGEVESALAALWAKVLKVSRIGRRDHFFSLGGHSLLVMTMISRLRRMLAVEITSKELFAQPVLADFAEAVKTAEPLTVSPIPLVSREAALPLSFSQQRLWFLAQIEGGSRAYHICMGARLRGPLDRAALRQALNQIVQRHEALRTRFIHNGDEPVQVISPASDFALRECSLSGQAEPQRELDELRTEETGRPFDLAEGPLIRGLLVRLDQEEHLLLITMHHIVSDGWSMGVFTHELSVLYRAYHEGRENPLAPLTIQYADYAAWQRQWLSGDVLSEQSEYWRRALTGAPALLELPTDRPRPAEQNFAGAAVPLELDAELTQNLKALSARYGMTLYMTVLAAWATVLSRLSGQDEIVIGTPAANRTQPEIEDLIGFFVNTQALRIGVSGRISELLNHVKARALDAQMNQELPFEQVVEIVNPPRHFSYSPIFQAMLAWQNNDEGVLELSGLTVSQEDPPDYTAKFDLLLNISEAGERIAGQLIYATALFDRSTIERHLGYLRRVLRAMVEDQSQSVDEIALLDDTERHQLVVAFNDTSTPYPAEGLVHELFEACVTRHPDTIAVVCEQQSLTYGELNRQANRLAHSLIRQGVKPDDRVAVCVERSIDMVVGLLAVLKAGAGYVPLDSSYPLDRLAYMIAHSAPRILLTHTRVSSSVRTVLNGDALIVLDLQADAPRWSSEPDHNPDCKAAGLRSSHLAYVMYTSGSTGQPKGVAMPHTCLVNLLSWLIANTPQPLHTAQYSSLGFDMSFTEIFSALCSGASLTIIPADERLEFVSLYRLLNAARIERLLLPTAAMRMFAEAVDTAAQTEAPLGLKELIVAGEQLVMTAPIVRLLQRLKGCRLFNHYGPTESHVVTACEVTLAASEAQALPPIGKPIANSTIYLLDAHLQPVPMSVVGEIYIGGVQVARGYLHSPALTAERFIKDPFSADPGAQLYKTGDLGRYLPDGSIEYLGRNDFQLKIRGFRVEPGEIEARLIEHDSVREAVVIAREDAAGGKSLVAYVTTPESTIDVDALRTHLSSTLPGYMVPAAYVRLEFLPLTSNGKLDRKALPAPDNAAYATRDYEAPVGEVEQSLAQIWGAVLKLARVGRHDNFFELGGHSLLAVALISRLRRTLHVNIPLKELFAHPTLSAFAEKVKNASRAVLSPVLPIFREQALPLSFAQQRLWFLAQMEGVSEAYHIPMGLRLRGKLDRPALRRALERVVQRHEVLRTRFIPGADGPVQLITRISDFALQESSCGDGAKGELALEALMAEEATRLFDLEKGPLIRGHLIRLSETEHVLLITMHHIVSDGWSIDVLRHELGVLYGAYHEGREDPLEPLTIQYADYAMWQRRLLSGEALNRQSEYWRRTLAGAPALLDLPTDRPRPTEQSFAGRTVEVALDATLTRDLKALSARHGLTLYMTLLAAWVAVLSKLSGQDEVVIGTAVTNRTQVELENLIGFFVNTQALRICAAGRVDELLEHVKARTLDAHEHHDLPFEQVVEIVKPSRSLSHQPIFQAMLAWQSEEDSAIEFPGLTVSSVAGRYDTVKFDLELVLGEVDGRIAGTLSYPTALFDHSTIERQVGYLRQMLEAMVTDEHQPVDGIDILSAAERRQLLVDFNATAVAYPEDQLIHELFEAQVTARPNAVAVAFRDQTLSYAQLNEQANRLAHHLISVGVKPGDRVAICAERSIEMVVGLLAVLKAGGAYVPLDQSYPLERLAYMIKDCAPVALLTYSSTSTDVLAPLRERLSIEKIPVLDLRDDAESWGGERIHDPDPETLGLTSTHLAYIIYTSGSTGLPKGVMVQHRPVINLIQWVNREFAVGPGDRVLFTTSLSFDLSVYDVFGLLAAGGRVHIASQDDISDPQRLVQILCSEGITFWDSAPAVCSRLTPYLNELPQAPRSLRLAFFSGDWIPLELPDIVRRAFPSCQIVSLGGATEATVWSNYFPVKEIAPHWVSIPYGRPIANARYYLLNSALSPCPIGVTGDLYIGGDCLSLGYLNRPELTAERYISDPFSADPRARLYKTGDLGRHLPDGNIEFLGRRDTQVKIRGFRIELGEIEARLSEHESVRTGVVLAREDSPGDKRLVAYVVPAVSGIDVQALRAHLGSTLPEYMVPAAYVQLSSLPLTSNGKLDRNALPAPRDAGYPARAYEEPIGEVEKAIAQIWANVLKVERVGRRDHFFELGGHSLSAVTAIGAVRSALAVEVALKELFAHPVLADFAQRLETASRVTFAPMRPVSREQALPLSFAQQRLWFLAQIEGVSEAYHIPMGLRLRGKLDRQALRRSLDRIVQRHEALRTTFKRAGDAPVQVIASKSHFALEEHELSDRTEGALELQQRIREEATRPFDLERGPLIRGQLLRLREDDHVLLITMHHIVSDGWSIGIFINELSALYCAFHEDREDPLAPLNIQYADYAVWQRERLSGEALSKQGEYWRRTLADAPALLELPTDRPRPAQQSFIGSMVAVEVDAQLTRDLKALGARHGMTLYMVVLAAWAAVLSRLSGQNEVVIGTVTANRGRPEIANLIGFFVNTQALRIGVSGRVSELLDHIKARTLDAQEHQELPFEQVVEIVKPPRSVAHTPIFQAMLAWQNNDEGKIELPGLAIAPAEDAYEFAKFDLELNLSEASERITGTLTYATALFDRGTIERHVGYLHQMLKAMVADEQQELDRIALLSESERHQLLTLWNAAPEASLPARCIHERFEQHALQAPNAIAVEFEERTLTYAELNTRANRLAHRIIRLGVKPDDRVAICAERSFEMLVGLLAILKAGGGYVPLDPSYPLERLQYLLADSAPAGLLIHTPQQPDLVTQLAAPFMLDLQSAASSWANEPDTNPDPRALGLTDRNLAYVIYTSGTTGQPKGVMIEHSNVARLFTATAHWFDFGHDDVWTLFHSYAFDFSVWEIWGALSHGGRLIVVPQETTRSPQEFYRLLCNSCVTVLNQTPTAFRQLIAAQAAADSSHHLRYVIFGGEALEAATLKPWYQRVTNQATSLINMYGITETTVHVTYRPLQPADTVSYSASPIGHRIPDLTVYVLDAHRQPVPMGSVGEMYVGGAGVARGYLNRPELTAERFIADPFSSDPQARLYRTGDLGRFLPDGSLEYLGRNDSQVKVRGFRIELGEIEMRLSEHPDVREAVVLAREDHPGDKRLVAYVITAEPAIDVTALRTHLSRVLPDYMVPSAYVQLDVLPLTQNGKLDQKALPAPGSTAYVTRAYEEPAGEFETALAAIWACVLKIDRVGRHDNFFELGGHSLLAVTVIERMREAGLYADVRALFATPTLMALAAAVGRDRNTVNVPPNLIPVDCTAITPAMLPLVKLSEADIERIVSTVQGGAGNVQDIYPLAPMQEGILFHHLMSPGSDPYLLHSVSSFTTREHLNRYVAALQAVVDRHDILRTAILWEDLPEPVQVVWRHATLIVEEIELSPCGGDIAQQLLDRVNPQHYSLDLARAPLRRLFIAEDAANSRWIMLELLHHLVDDNTSLRFMFGEVQAHLSGELTQLPAPLPFRNFVAQACLGVSREEHEAFFTQMLGDVDEVTAPFGLIDVQGDGSQIIEAHHDVDLLLSRRLRACARTLGVSAASLFHLAWASILAHLSGRDDVVFGTVMFGRMQGGEGADRVLGMFINTLPVRIRVAEESARAAVRKMHELLTQLLRHEHASLALAQRCSAVHAPAPLFTALLNYRHVTGGSSNNDEAFDEAAARAWAGMEVLSVEERSNYPLVLSVNDLDDGFSLDAQVDGSVDPQRVCAYMHTALESLVTALERAPETPLQDLEVLPVAERRQLLVTGRGTPSAYPSHCCIHELIEAHVARAPDANAVVFAKEVLTYGELNAQANRLAHHLRTLGVGPDVRVAILMERSVEMVIALLAVLKSGGCYVPLDPSHPPDRLNYMLADSAPRVLLTHPAVTKVYGSSAVVLDLKLDADAWSTMPDTDIDRRSSGLTTQNLAYVIYTSGTTGQPKGVMVAHNSVVNLLWDFQRSLQVSAADRVLALTTLAFDIAGLEHYLPLISGATSVLVDRMTGRDPASLIAALSEHHISIMQATPTQWRMLLDAGWQGSRTLQALCGGEALNHGLAVELARRVSRLMNVYGPTETTIWSSSRWVFADMPPCVGYVPIGRPIANTHIYVLDGRQRPVAAGVPGEIYIGGAGLARGYLNRPELSAQRFIRDPHSDAPNALLYRTGDVGRVLPDGEIEYLSRNDHQVKIRGFRIELGEIEARLTEHPAVKEAVVLARNDGPEGVRLVAYVIGHAPSSALREYLIGALPDYMVPTAFVVLDRLPLTPNGKVNRKALPAPEYSAPADEYVPPATPSEVRVAQIVAQVLRRDKVSAHASFFELGGHSLLVMQLVSRIRQVFGVHLPLREIFESARIDRIAASVDGLIAARTQAAGTRKESLAKRIDAMSDEEIRKLLEKKRRVR